MAETPDSREIIDALRKLKPKLQKGFGITRLRVFGLVARGESGPDSDVDLIADFEQIPEWSFFTIDEKKEFSGRHAMAGNDDYLKINPETLWDVYNNIFFGLKKNFVPFLKRKTNDHTRSPCLSYRRSLFHHGATRPVAP